MTNPNDLAAEVGIERDRRAPGQTDRMLRLDRTLDQLGAVAERQAATAARLELLISRLEALARTTANTAALELVEELARNYRGPDQ